jgi:L-alanine-DL-glutamate epimerase-like enolase superfamily enzyme
MHRRDFLAGVLAAPVLSTWSWAKDLPDDVRITRIVGFEVISQRNKVAGKNSRLDVHGDRATDRLVRVITNMGVEGVGDCRMSREDAQKLLGRNPFDFYQVAQTQFTGPIGPTTMPLWDLAGKVLEKPVYELLGGAGPQRVPVYDGSIYFADLLPQYESRWRDRLREEIDLGRGLGHRAFKVKIGRGAKWMPRVDGDLRDIEVLKTIREHAGEDLLLGVDANNGYDLEGAKRAFDHLGPLGIAFAEEMFPEVVEHCLDFKQFVSDQGWKTLVADGETQGEIDVFKPFIAAKAIDLYQADMTRFGYEGILYEAALARPQGLMVAPHNWGRYVGYFMQLHIGRAIPNFYRAEHDPLTNRVLIADGYAIEQGEAIVPDTPGCGLTLREEAFSRNAKILYDIQS